MHDPAPPRDLNRLHGLALGVLSLLWIGLMLYFCCLGGPA